MSQPNQEIAVIGQTTAAARHVCIEGPAGLLRWIAPSMLKTWNRSLGELLLTNGTRYKTFSGEEPDRLRGPQHHRAFVDELAAMPYVDETWDMMTMGLRLGKHPQVVVATTPKPIKLLKNLLQRRDVLVTRGSTFENSNNLPVTMMRMLKEQYGGSRLGRQELEAELLTDTPGALWTWELIEKSRCPEPKREDLKRVVVSIDPAVTAHEGSDETGIIVSGIDKDDNFIVLQDASMQGSPEQWSTRAIQLYRSWGADRVVAETNNGGDMVENVLRATDRNIAYTGVRASRGKYVRAEPVSNLYERGKAKHAGKFPLLEDQMTTYAPGDKKSPDRMDALVWGAYDLVVKGSELQIFV